MFVKYKSLFKKIIVFFYIGIFLPVVGLAKDTKFEIKLQKDTVSPGKQVKLEMIFVGEREMPAPETPFILG